MLDISTFNETVCRCSDPPGTMFATTFYVPPNKIDFHAVWGKFDPENAAVYGTIAALLVIYFLALLYLRRKDKQDVTKVLTSLRNYRKVKFNKLIQVDLYTAL